MHHTRNRQRKRFSRIVIPSEVEGSLLASSFSPALLNRLYETPYPTCMEYQASCFRSHAHRAFHRERKRFLAFARNDNVGNGYPVHHTKNVWEKCSFRIVIPSEVEGSLLQTSFSPALLNRLHETPYPTCMEYQASRFRSHAHRAFHRERKRFLAALEMTVRGMPLYDVSCKDCAEKALFP